MESARGLVLLRRRLIQGIGCLLAPIVLIASVASGGMGPPGGGSGLVASTRRVEFYRVLLRDESSGEVALDVAFRHMKDARRAGAAFRAARRQASRRPIGRRVDRKPVVQ